MILFPQKLIILFLFLDMAGGGKGAEARPPEKFCYCTFCILRKRPFDIQKGHLCLSAEGAGV